MSREEKCASQAFACAESLFKTLKVEVDKLKKRYTKEKVRVEVFEYMKLYYNKRRRHFGA
jgi:transposase InsO family protein